MLKPSNIKPVNGRFFIRVIENEQEYQGSLELARSTTKEVSNIAVVEEAPVGYNSEGHFQKGAKVFFGRNSGSVIVFDKFDRAAPEYRLIREEDILALIDDSST